MGIEIPVFLYIESGSLQEKEQWIQQFSNQFLFIQYEHFDGDFSRMLELVITLEDKILLYEIAL